MCMGTRGTTMDRYRIAISILLASCLANGIGCKSQKASSPSIKQREIRVAAAADLKFAFDALADEFRAIHPDVALTVTYGSSGNFYAQLSNGAPFDIFLSADIQYPRKLIESGIADKDSEFLYAIGHLVVWVPNNTKLNVSSLSALTDPAVKKIAIANPTVAPYGHAAEAALKKSGIYEQVKDRLVFGENIAQAAQFVESQAADAGMIALSLAKSAAMRDKGRYWEVPPDLYPRLDQGGVVMKSAKDREAALSLRSFILSDEGRTILKRFGFDISKE